MSRLGSQDRLSPKPETETDFKSLETSRMVRDAKSTLRTWGSTPTARNEARQLLNDVVRDPDIQRARNNSQTRTDTLARLRLTWLVANQD